MLIDKLVSHRQHRIWQKHVFNQVPTCQSSDERQIKNEEKQKRNNDINYRKINIKHISKGTKETEEFKVSKNATLKT